LKHSHYINTDVAAGEHRLGIHAGASRNWASYFPSWILKLWAGSRAARAGQNGAAESIPEELSLFRDVFYHAAGMALVSSDGRWLNVNPSMCGKLGYTELELLNKPIGDITHPDDVRAVVTNMKKLLNGKASSYQIEQRYLHKYGHSVWVLLNASLVPNSQVEPARFVFQVQDITERKLAEEKLVHDVFHDALTGLPNRALFLDRLTVAIERARRRPGEFAVLFLDLDGFKEINDNLGHMVGDQLLIEIARRLRACLRMTDTIARLGGDEFTIILEDLEDQKETIRIVERLQQELAQPIKLGNSQASVTASIGIASGISNYARPEEVVRDADSAMYQAKAAGKARYEVFDGRGHSASLSHMQNDLSNAVDRRQLLLFYQPIVTLQDGRLIGFEALVRWKHPQRGIIFPVDFIHMAEGTGAINHIARWVLREACHQLRQWHEQYPFHRYITMSVNLSAKQFMRPDLIDEILAALQEASLAPGMLKLEITESVLMDNIETSAGMLQQLRALGVELSIDDFGTGYSSLSYLHRLPINNLKIDQSFVNRIVKNDENTEIIRSIVALAQRLGMTVVAEGVETLQQLAELRLLNCDAGQGYLFSKPVGAKAAGNLMASTMKWQSALVSLAKHSRPELASSLHTLSASTSRSPLLQAV